MMRAWEPLLIECPVAPGNAAGLGTEKQPGGDHPAGIGASIGGNEICDGESSLPAGESDRRRTDRKNQDAQHQRPRQLGIAALRKLALRKTVDDVEDPYGSKSDSGHEMYGMHTIGNENSQDSFTNQPQTAEAECRPAYPGPQSGAPPAGGRVAISLAPVFDKNHREWGDGRKADDDRLGLLSARETEKKVLEVLDQLSERDRRLLREVFLEERDKDEVCRDFGVDREYLRVLLHRAKQSFKSVYLKRTGNDSAEFKTA